MLFKESFCLEVHNNSEYTNTMFYLYIHTDPLQGVNILTGLTTLILLIAQTMTYKTPICNAPPNQTTANNLNVSQSLKETIQLMLQPISLKLFLVSDSKKKKKSRNSIFYRIFINLNLEQLSRRLFFVGMSSQEKK